MRKIIFAAILPLFLLPACDRWLDINTDPNSPESVPPELSFASPQLFVAARVGGNIFNFAGFFAQYWTQAPTSEQYLKPDTYDVRNEFLDNDYTFLYAGALMDLQQLESAAAASGDYGTLLAAVTLKAYTVQELVDLMGMAPYSEALRGIQKPMPAWDKGEDVYSALIEELTQAIAQVEAAPQPVRITENDLLLKGSVAQWAGFARAVKLKLLMRESGVKSNLPEVTALIAEGKFFSGNVAFSAFAAEPGKDNPWYETNIVRLSKNHSAAYPIISYLSANADPRLDVLFYKPDRDSVYRGNFPGWRDQQGKDGDPTSYSTPKVAQTMPVYLYTQSELQLFIAEAMHKAGDDAKAQKAYEAAIDSSFALHGLSCAGAQALYGAGGAYAWNPAKAIEQIGMQKWVALCMVNHAEAYNEVRRLGYPKFSTATAEAIKSNPAAYTSGDLIYPKNSALGFGHYVNSLPYPVASSKLNSNTPTALPITAKVWWNR
ncbi:MAG: SusD/RagB family nutrient-binding outer membrane lipoprotein [Prevotellaceae bacterium]|jgi:hypothetical protein|nr:SusD/RagB family nutrient-binding outer membrane lipoprotein [Prevotellaceae bacterium]